MKNAHTCPKCGSRDIVRIPDHPSRYASGSNIYTSKKSDRSHVVL